MFDSVIRSVVAEEYNTVFIIVQADLGHLFAITNGGGSTSPDVVTSLEIYVYKLPGSNGLMLKDGNLSIWDC